MADKNERTFTEEQLRAHEGELNLQMGYNKGATQSGHGGKFFLAFLNYLRKYDNIRNWGLSMFSSGYRNPRNFSGGISTFYRKNIRKIVLDSKNSINFY